MEYLRKLWNTKPLILILGLAFIARMVSVIWAKGFGMHDDHFLIIEAAQSWVDGTDYNNWLPKEDGSNTPSGHSFFYVGVHYFLFQFLEAMGFYNPGFKMFIVRLLHAVFSLISVWIAFLFVKRYGSIQDARMAGLLLAVYWFMPWLSVRNLVEVVCIPFLMAGTYLAIRSDEDSMPWYGYILSGLILGIAFSIRYQTILFSGGVMLALCFHKKWLGGILVGLAYVAMMALIQGIPDYLIWGKPFVELQEYIRYNIVHSDDFVNSPWYSYLLLILGILIPPVSIYFLVGFFAAWKKHLLIFLPVALFLVFHSIFPNKQERFVLPLIPFLIMAGISGWNLLGQKWKSIFMGRRIRAVWIFFCIINLLLLPLVSTMYSKRARVESMEYLSVYQDIRTIIVDERPKYGINYPPEFYLGQWISVIERSKGDDIEDLEQRLSFFAPEDNPRFVLFYDDKELIDRVEEIRSLIPGLVFEKRIRPGMIDAFMHWLNPNNANQSIFIYRNTAFIPEPWDASHGEKDK